MKKAGGRERFERKAMPPVLSWQKSKPGEFNAAPSVLIAEGVVFYGEFYSGNCLLCVEDKRTVDYIYDNKQRQHA